MNKGLTSFRGLTFLSIFLFHCYVFEAGDLAVQGFFVLSGFLIINILFEMKKDFHGKNYFIYFYSRRALRIFPLYFFYLLLTFVLCAPFYYPEGHSGIQRIDRFFSQLPWAITYTYNFFHASEYYKHTHLLTHFWSLAVEEQFYLVFGLVLYLTPQRYFKNLLVALMIAGPFIRLATAAIVDHSLIPGLGHQTDLVTFVLPFSHFDAFATGGFFALYGRSGTTSTVFGFLFFVIFIGMLTSWLHDGNTQWFAFGYVGYMRDSYKIAWGYTLLNVFFAHMIATISDRKFLPTIMESAPLHYLGEISYGLYVFHYPMIWLSGLLVPDWFEGLARIVIAFILTLGIASLSYRFLEKPAINLKDKFFPKAPKVTSVA